MLVIFLVACTCLGDANVPETPPRTATHDTIAEAARPHVTQCRCESGFVFIDGVYLAPPYNLETTSSGLTTNGQVLPSGFPQPSGVVNGSEGTRRGKGRRRPFAGPIGTVRSCLMNDGIVVAFTDRPLVYITSIGVALEFFVVATGRNPERLESLLATLPAEEDRRLWTSWLRGFAMPEDLRTRADALIDAVQPIEDHNLARVAAVHRIDRLAYPLTVVGMIFSVLSLGHLLMSVPSRAVDPMLQSQGIRAAVISAILVAAFSLLDLVWTVLAHQAGQMREMNPLGSRLLEDPRWLVTFKILVTLTCCAILLALRARHSARLASWWLCLVCTIVTFRWLMFNSMFVGS